MLSRKLKETVSVAAVAASTLAATSVTAEERKPILLDDVVVENAARDGRSLLDTTTGASVVGREEMDRRQATTYEELIGDTPGVLIEGGPRGIAEEPNIRGFQDEQIVLRVDGGRLNFNQAHRGRFFLDPDIVERVEVIRGGGSTVQGSGALGGVIAIDTRDAYDLLDEGETVGARFRTSFETNGDAIGQTATVYGAQGGFDALGFIAYRDRSDDLTDGGGADIIASQIDIVNGLAKLGYEEGASRFEAVASYYVDDGITPVAADGAVGPSNPTVDRDAEIATGRLSWDYAPADNPLLDLSVLGYINTLGITETRQLDGRIDTTDYDTVGFEAVNRSSVDIGVPATFVYGLEFVRDSQTGTRNGATRLQFPDASATTYSGFLEAQIQLTEQFTITPGVRYDRYELNPTTQPDRSESKFSPRIGVSFRPVPELQIYGNYSRAFRTPSLTELYSDDVHFAIPGFPLDATTTFTGVNSFVPAPNLKPETSDQFEAGFRFSEGDVFQPGDALSFSVGGYYAKVDNFIDQTVSFLDFSTARFDPFSGQLLVSGTTTSVNVDAELYGAEFEARYDAGDWWLSLGGAIPRGDDSTGAPLNSIPQDRVTASVGYRPTDEFELGLRGTVAFSKNNATVTADAYETVDVFFSYAPETPPFDGLVLRAGVDNVFDETFSIHPNPVNQPGRTFKLSGSIRF